MTPQIRLADPADKGVCSMHGCSRPGYWEYMTVFPTHQEWYWLCKEHHEPLAKPSGVSARRQDTGLMPLFEGGAP